MFAFMQDIHIGAKFTNESLFQSLNLFLKLIREHKEECKCIFVCGDLFEHKLSVEEATVAADFLASLVCNNCGRNGKIHVPVHFIHGTCSHDRDQYEIFMPLISKLPNADVFYANEATSIVFNGIKILYLPQEYGDKSYDELFKSKYDIIVGHGPISSTTKAPCPTKDYDILHSAELLGDISKICVFGHYHGYTDFGNNVYYGGPWLRWKYGEDEPRQFVFCTDDYKLEIHPNPYAVEYRTIDIATVDELRSYISQDITTPYRFCISVDEDNLNEFHAIMNINKNNPNISYKISSIKKEETVDDKVSAEYGEYNRTANVEPVPALISYIQDKYDIDVSDEIHEYETRIKESEK